MPRTVVKKAKVGRPRLSRPHGEVCSVPGCGRALSVGHGGNRDYCPLHYQRHRRGARMIPESVRETDLGELVSLQARISKVTVDRLQQLAEQTGRRQAALLRDALEYWQGLPDRNETLNAQATDGAASLSSSSAKQCVVTAYVPKALNQLLLKQSRLASRSQILRVALEVWLPKQTAPDQRSKRQK